MPSDVLHCALNLEGFQVSNTSYSEVAVEAENKKLLPLAVKEGKKAYLNVFLKEKRPRCPHCHSTKISLYCARERIIRGPFVGNAMMLIHVNVYQCYCQHCKTKGYTKLDFLPYPKCNITKDLARMVLALRTEMSISAISALLDLPWHLVKQIEMSYLKETYADIPLDNVKAIGIDEIYIFRTVNSNEKYLTIVRDLNTGAVLEVADGKGVEALKAFGERIKPYAENIQYVCMDMSNAYHSWVNKELPNAFIVFDKFHLVKAMNDKIDQCRRKTMSQLDKEQKADLKGLRYAFLRNANHLKPDVKLALDNARETHKELSDVYLMKEDLRGIYLNAFDYFDAKLLFVRWCEKAEATGIVALKTLAKTITNHLEGILGFWRFKGATNASTEGFNTKIRWLITQAYGFSDRAYLKLKIFDLPRLNLCRTL